MRTPVAFREQLLQTEPDALDAEAQAAVRAFCEDSPEVEAAYVCAAERRTEGEPPEAGLHLSFKLLTPVSEPGDSRAAQRELVARLSRRHPELLRRFGGFGVLADRAVPAWERYGIRVFSRATGP